MNNTIEGKPIGESRHASIGFSDSTNPLFSGESTAQAAGEKFVVFFLNGNLYGVSADKVAEVSQPLAIVALPNAPGWLLGIGNLRGEIVAIVNLPKIIGENSPVSTKKTKLIVLKTKNTDAPIAFPIDKLNEIVQSNDVKYETPVKNDSPFVSAKFNSKSNVVNLIDSDKLLNFLTIT